MTNVAKCNRLRIAIWELDQELAGLMAPMPEYRNQAKIDAVRKQISELEDKIKNERSKA